MALHHYLLLVGLLFGLALAGKPMKECQYNGTVSGLTDNCTRIIGNVMLTGTDDVKTLYSKLAYVEDIMGCIQISGSSYVRLDFFARLRTVTCANTIIPSDFMVSNNSLLERLGMPVLKVSRLGLTYNPKLCLTLEERSRYTNVQRGNSDNFTVACQGRSGDLKECYSQANQLNGGLTDGCEVILGNLYIDGTANANITDKVQFIKEVNGRIYVRATNLTTLTIPILEKVYSSEAVASTLDEPTISIAGNTNLTKLDVPKINFMAKNDFSFKTADTSYVMDQGLCNRLSPFGSVMSNNGTICVSIGSRANFWVAASVVAIMFINKL